MVTRRVPAFDPAVVTVARMSAGSTFNVIPETATLAGTIRAVSEVTRAATREGIERVAAGVAAAHQCTAQVDWVGMPYPVTVNEADAVDEALAAARTLVDPEGVFEMPTPVMGAEDWSFVLQRVRGCMVFLGAAPAGVAHPAPNHSNRMVIAEEPLAVGAALHAAMALRPA